MQKMKAKGMNDEVMEIIDQWQTKLILQSKTNWFWKREI